MATGCSQRGEPSPWQHAAQGGRGGGCHGNCCPAQGCAGARQQGGDWGEDRDRDTALALLALLVPTVGVTHHHSPRALHPRDLLSLHPRDLLSLLPMDPLSLHTAPSCPCTLGPCWPQTPPIPVPLACPIPAGPGGEATGGHRPSPDGPCFGHSPRVQGHRGRQGQGWDEVPCTAGLSIPGTGWEPQQPRSPRPADGTRCWELLAQRRGAGQRIIICD